MDSTSLITTSVVVLGATTFVADVKKGDVSVEPFVSAAFVGIFLGLISLVFDPVARAFAILIIAVALLRNGATVFGTLGGFTK